MRRVSYRTSIAAQAQRVCDALQSFNAWLEWNPTIRSIRGAHDRPSAGDVLLVEQHGVPKATWCVIWVNELGFAWETVAPGLRIVATHSIIERTGGMTGVELAVEFFGPLAGVAALLTRPANLRAMRKELDGLRRYCTS